MQRQWKDPRDGQEWLVTVTPFGWTAKLQQRNTPEEITVSFHRPGTPPIWTRYSGERPISEATEQDLMDFLDVARRRAHLRRDLPRYRRRQRSG